MNTRIPRLLFGATVALLVAALFFFLPMHARAGGVVTNCTEGGLDGALAGGGAVTFNCNGNNSPATIYFSTTYRTITLTTSIDGSNGGNTIAIVPVNDSGSRVFSVTNGIALTLTNLILGSGFDFDGGCIYSNGVLVLDNVEMINCQAATGTHGGAIYVSGTGSATLNNSRVYSSTAWNGGGGIYNLGLLALSNSTVISGSIAKSNHGGGIYNAGTATLNNSTVFSNSSPAGVGGGIYNYTGALALTNSNVISNTSSANGGGGIWNEFGTATLTNTAVMSNATSGIGASGGGIYNDFGTATLANSSVSGNSASAGGGGIENVATLRLINSTVSGNRSSTGGGVGNGGTLTLTNSTISGNTTTSDSGGLYTDGLTATVTSSTISGNTSGNDGGGIFHIGTSPLYVVNSTISGNHSNVNGGGIYNASGTTSLFNATVTGNLANADASGNGYGGGVANASGTFNSKNSIIAKNLNILPTLPFPTLNFEDCYGTITSGGNNIMYDTTDCTVSGGGVTLTDPNLGSLANNGGPTQTHALLVGSPAIDAGNAGGCADNNGATLTTDQRGFHRPVNGGVNGVRCDIGAYEYDPPTVFMPLITR